VRAEGFTELLGDVLITCQGGDPSTSFLANFQLFLNTQVTSRLVDTTNSLTEAMLLVDEPGVTAVEYCPSPGPASNGAGFGGVASPACNVVNAATPFQTGAYSAYLGQVGGLGAQSQAVLTWTSIPVVPPGSNRTRTFRITNVRGNANGVGVSSTFLPNQIIGFLSVSPTGSLPLTPPQVTMAYVQQGLVFDTRNCANGGGIGSALPFDACVNRGGSQFRPGGTPGSDSGSPLAAHASLRFREGFATAFKTRALAGNEGPVNTATTFNSESGLIRTTTFGEVGRATQGTRLVARFGNIPANVRLYVSTQNVPLVSNAPAGAGALVGSATLVNGTDLAGAGGSLTPLVSAPSFSLNCGTSTVVNPDPTGSPLSSVGGSEVILTNGTGTAVWEVLNSTSGQDDLLFWVGAAFNAAGTNAVATGTGTVTGSFAPFYAVPTSSTGPIVAQPTTLYPVPRFAASGDASNIVQVSPCLTSLLFPYVTNWAGFDTGIAIANTSRDPFGSPNDRLQGGTCELFYYGRQANGDDPVRASETTNAAVAAGETITLVLSTGGSLGLQGNANFQGYIIANCNFRFAHGFAFITDGPIGSAQVAEGYLALVLSGPGQARGITESGEVRAH
jgi:hypothetical protein